MMDDRYRRMIRDFDEQEMMRRRRDFDEQEMMRRRRDFDEQEMMRRRRDYDERYRMRFDRDRDGYRADPPSDDRMNNRRTNGCSCGRRMFNW